NDEGEIGLVYNPPSEPKLVSRASKRQPMMAIVGPDFPRRSHKVLTVQQLATYPLAATHPSYGTRQMMEAVEYAERVRLAPIITTNSFAILKEFVKSGLGISVMPAFAVTAELQARELFAIDIAHPILENAEAHMVTRVGRKLSVAANKMLQMMTGQMRAFR
ncbi:LysR substrate-binding domain-containing protein, partial [Burkholderia sp. E168m23]